MDQAPTTRRTEFLGFACAPGTVDTVVLPLVVGIPQPSNVVLRVAGQNVFLVGLPPELVQLLRGRMVTICGLAVRVFGSGPFAGQSVIALVPLFLL